MIPTLIRNAWAIRPERPSFIYAGDAQEEEALDRQQCDPRRLCIARSAAQSLEHNTPSQRLCEKLGMRREGVFVECVSCTRDDAGNPIYENTMQYAILRHEWMSGARATVHKRR